VTTQTIGLEAKDSLTRTDFFTLYNEVRLALYPVMDRAIRKIVYSPSYGSFPDDLFEIDQSQQPTFVEVVETIPKTEEQQILFPNMRLLANVIYTAHLYAEDLNFPETPFSPFCQIAREFIENTIPIGSLGDVDVCEYLYIPLIKDGNAIYGYQMYHVDGLSYVILN